MYLISKRGSVVGQFDPDVFLLLFQLAFDSKRLYQVKLASCSCCITQKAFSINILVHFSGLSMRLSYAN